MGTRSDIIVERRDGKFARIYCHWDGYIANNGKLLFEHYNRQDKAESLVALGDTSSLGEVIGKKHDFDWRMKYYKTPEHPKFKLYERMCNVYGRDRGEKNTEASVGDSLAEVWPGSDCGTEFTYVWTGGRWMVGDPDEGQQTLRDLGAVIAGDEPEPATAIKAFGGNFVIGHR